MKITTLTVFDGDTIVTTIHPDTTDAGRSLGQNHDPENEAPIEADLVEWLANNRGLVVFLEEHEVQHHYNELDGFKCRESDDEVKGDLELTHEECGTVLCDVEHGDTLSVLAWVATEHMRFNANVGSQCPAHPLNRNIRPA